MARPSKYSPELRERAVRLVLDQILDTGMKNVGILGFSFKAGTDDLRESPIVILAEALLGKGVSLRIYDRNVSMAKLVGANKDYIVKQIPHLSSLLCNSIVEVIDGSEVIVVGNQAPEFADAVKARRSGHIVIDSRPAADRRLAVEGRLQRDLLVEHRVGRAHRDEEPQRLRH
jgi:GDP-mannose 6-dehydrogenase